MEKSVSSKTKNTGTKHFFPGQLGSFFRVGYVSHDKVTEELLYRRLGHCGINRLRAAKHHCAGFPNLNPNTPFDPNGCDACLRGGAVHKPFSSNKGDRRFANILPKQHNKYKLFGEFVSSDLLGPLPKSVHHNYTYAIDFHDAATKTVETYFLKKDKSSGEVMDALTSFQRNNGTVKVW